MMKKKKYSDINNKNEDIYVFCEMKATDKATSEYIYYMYLNGEVVPGDDELNADDVRRMIACLTTALKATGEWKEEGGAQ